MPFRAHDPGACNLMVNLFLLEILVQVRGWCTYGFEAQAPNLGMLVISVLDEDAGRNQRYISCTHDGKSSMTFLIFEKHACTKPNALIPFFTVTRPAFLSLVRSSHGMGNVQGSFIIICDLCPKGSLLDHFLSEREHNLQEAATFVFALLVGPDISASPTTATVRGIKPCTYSTFKLMSVRSLYLQKRMIACQCLSDSAHQCFSHGVLSTSVTMLV